MTRVVERDARLVGRIGGRIDAFSTARNNSRQSGAEMPERGIIADFAYREGAGFASTSLTPEGKLRAMPAPSHVNCDTSFHQLLGACITCASASPLTLGRGALG